MGEVTLDGGKGVTTHGNGGGYVGWGLGVTTGMVMGEVTLDGVKG